ncbi:MBL fold metallo-hydrolase [Solibacillus sp. FSL R7-0668]|uniref:MBL fold metallo-hydrolase n=1 Tax=Solibacillus sp. FSL R7-0668 TaxID=2921688 RepID=UPI0030F738CF
MHKFTYHNVGQGLFFEGCFQCGGQEITIVYDCGAEKSYKSNLNNVISKFQLSNNHIDILVISHFDFDHISGIKKLLSQCTVSHIVLPYLTNEDILIHLLKQRNVSTHKDELWYLEFLKNPQVILSEFESIKRITFIVNEFEKSIWSESLDLNNENIENNIISTFYNHIEINFQKSTHIYLVNSYLKLKFFNYSISLQKKRAFMKKIENEMKIHGDFNIHSLAKRVLSNRTETETFKRNYRYVSKSNHNNISLLMMYDFKIAKGKELKIEIKEEQFNFLENVFHYYPFNNCRFVHFFTGDISFKYVRKHLQIYEHYKDLLPHVDVIQVPHHGSKHNWNDDLLWHIPKKAFFIVSSGIKNSYGHPHTEVVKSIEVRHKLFKANETESIYAEIL